MDFFLDASRCQTVMRCDVKRMERPTPQSWSPEEPCQSSTFLSEGRRCL